MRSRQPTDWPAAAARPDGAASASGLPPLRGGALVRLVARIIAWNRDVRRRRLPAHLSDRMIRDLGIDRSAADPESTVSYWRLR